MSDSQRWMALVVATLATWRLCHLVAHEDGPLDFVVRLRRRAGNGQLGALMDCPYCLSLWWAAPLAGWLTLDWALGVIAALGLWLGISGGACVIERLTSATSPPADPGGP
jgi:hypothetical protein